MLMKVWKRTNPISQFLSINFHSSLLYLNLGGDGSEIGRLRSSDASAVGIPASTQAGRLDDGLPSVHTMPAGSPTCRLASAGHNVAITLLPLLGRDHYAGFRSKSFTSRQTRAKATARGFYSTSCCKVTGQQPQ